MLHLEELKEDRMKLMVIVDQIYSDHCAKIGDCECPSNLAYVNATHTLYHTNEYDDVDITRHYRWLEEKVITSLLISINKLIKAGELRPLTHSESTDTINNVRLAEFIEVVINIVSTQNYEEAMLYL